MYLYEMSEATRELYELLTNEEIDEQTYNDTLEAIGVDEKLESYCKIIRQSEADAESLKTEISRLKDKKIKAENAVMRMKSAILCFLDSAGKNKADAGVFKVSKRRSQAVNIYDEALIPEEYFIQQKPELSKTKIKEAIAAGQTVEGAKIVENYSVVIK